MELVKKATTYCERIDFCLPFTPMNKEAELQTIWKMIGNKKHLKRRGTRGFQKKAEPKALKVVKTQKINKPKVQKASLVQKKHNFKKDRTDRTVKVSNKENRNFKKESS